MSKDDMLAILKEAYDFVDRHSESWYTPGQELLAKIEKALADITPKPVESDGAVDELLIEELRKVAIRDSTTIKTGQVIGRAIAALQARPAAPKGGVDGFETWARNQMAEYGPIKTVSGKDVYSLLLPPVARGAGVDAAVTAALNPEPQS